MCNIVLPSLSFLFKTNLWCNSSFLYTFNPSCFTKNLKASSLLYLRAICKTVSFRFVTSIIESGQNDRNSSNRSRFSPLSTTQCNGVRHSLPLTWTRSLSYYRSWRTSSICPFCRARWMGLNPFRSSFRANEGFKLIIQGANWMFP